VPVTRTSNAMRTIPTLVPGLLRDLIEATGCRPGGDSPLPGAASVTYRADGRAAQIAVNAGLPAACEQILRALVQLTIADAAYPPPASAPEWLVLPLGQDYIDCTSRADHAIVEHPSTSAHDPRIEPPRKIRDVRPLQKRRVQGQRRPRGRHQPSGCVAVIRVMRSVDASLDYSAVHAVSGWRFTPTTVNGREVPVMMTVTVNFNLQ
jgi:TonB family protein